MSKSFLMFVGIVVSLLFCSSVHAASKGDVAAWSVRDATGTLELTAVDESGPMWVLTVRNRSNAVITAVALSFKADMHYYQDWLNAEPSGLAPGGSFDVSLGAEDGTNHKLIFSAVIFEDGSGKGDSTQLDRMNCHRFGQILESTRIREILRNRNGSGDDSSLENITRDIGKMPLSAEDAFLSLAGVNVQGIQLNHLKQSGENARNAVFWGVSTTRERALHQVESIRRVPFLPADQNAPTRKELLSFIREQYDAQNRKGLSLLSRMQGGR